MAPPRYASKTAVPVKRSRDAIEQLLEKYGCGQFTSGLDHDHHRAQVQFLLEDRIIRFVIQLPDPADGGTVAARAQDERQRWRALFLSIKARLVSWNEKIETFEEAFMAHIVLPDDRTVGQAVIPAIVAAYATGRMPTDRLLPAYGGEA